MRREPYQPERAKHTATAAVGLSRRTLLAGGGTLAAGGFALAFTGSRPNALTPPQRLACEQPPSRTTAVLIDASDPFPEDQRAWVLHTVAKAAIEVEAGDRFVLTGLTRVPSEMPDIAISLCSPGNPNGSDWFQGSIYAERFLQEKYVAPVAAAAAALIDGIEHTTSPIMETIAALPRNPHFSSGATKRTLIILSDLLQNDQLPVRAGSKRRPAVKAGQYSQYMKGDIAAAYRQSTLGQSLQVDLTGVSVLIYYLARPEVAQYQNETHRLFWREWFAEAGASDVVLQPTFGVGHLS